MTNFVLTARVSVALFTNTVELPDPSGIETMATVTVTERHTINYTINGHPYVTVKEFELLTTKRPMPLPKPMDPDKLPKPQRRP
jgi:hypothetical protein